jgi:hypothetical protein
VEVPLDPAVVRYVGACEKILWGSTGRPVREWLNGRGFNDELLRANHVGADPGRQMMQRQRGLPYGGGVGAVFPALDERGEVAYVQTRYLNPGNGPKYDNPAASLGMNPCLAWTRAVGPERSGQLIVCEGIPDALTAAGEGYQAVAILGSQTPDHGVAYRIGRRAAQDQLHVTLVVDNDPAGLEWGDRLRMLLDDANVEVQVVTPPEACMDLNEWSRSSGPGIEALQFGVDPSCAPADIAG